jgi:hypothetical protein
MTGYLADLLRQARGEPAALRPRPRTQFDREQGGLSIEELPWPAAAPSPPRTEPGPDLGQSVPRTEMSTAGTAFSFDDHAGGSSRPPADQVPVPPDADRPPDRQVQSVERVVQHHEHIVETRVQTDQPTRPHPEPVSPGVTIPPVPEPPAPQPIPRQLQSQPPAASAAEKPRSPTTPVVPRTPTEGNDRQPPRVVAHLAPPAAPRPERPEAVTETEITISIGRLDISLAPEKEHAPQRQASVAASASPVSTVSLDEYLRSRSRSGS